MSNTHEEVLTKADKIDRYISFAIAFQIILLGCKNILIQGVPFLYGINEKLNIVILGLSLIFYCFAFMCSLNRSIRGGYTIFALFIALSFLTTYVFFPDNIPFLNGYILRTLICCFFTGFLISKLRTLQWFAEYMLKGSYFITLSLLLYAIEIHLIGHSTTSDWSSYSMPMSNVGLLAVMFQLHSYFKYKKKKDLLFAIIGCIVIFLYGSRNPFIAIVSYIVIQLFDVDRGGSKKGHKFLLYIAFVLAFILYLFKNRILLGLASLLESLSLSSRSLYYLINENNEDITTGRGDIHEQLWKVIWDNPIIGTGIAGDEANIQELAHGLYLSIYCTYGIFIGTLFIIYILAKTYTAHKQSYGLNHQLLVLFICLVFPRGFTGGDIWQNDIFWWMMGIIFFILTTKQQKKY